MTWSLLTSTEITKILDVFREYEGAARCLRCCPVRSRALAEHAFKVRVFVRLVNPFSPWRRTYSSGDGPLKVLGSPQAEGHLSLGKESIQVPQHAGPTPAGAELIFPYIPQTEVSCGLGILVLPRGMVAVWSFLCSPPNTATLRVPVTAYVQQEDGNLPFTRGSQCHAP